MHVFVMIEYSESHNMGKLKKNIESTVADKPHHMANTFRKGDMNSVH